MATALKSSSRRRESIYLALALLPIGLVAMALILGMAREAQCSAKVDTIVANLKIAGQPTDFASLAATHASPLPPAVRAEQIKIGNAAGYLNDRYSEVLGKFPESGHLTPPSKFLSCEKILAKYSNEATPIISQVGDSFQNTDTLHLLERDFRAAYHSGDTKHALEIFNRIGPDQEQILKSLEHNVWTADDLTQLREMVGSHPDLSENWTRNINNARGTFLALLYQVDSKMPNQWGRFDSPHQYPFGIAPSHMLARLRFLDRAEQLQALGTKNARDSAEALENSSGTFSLVSTPLAMSNRYDGYGFVRIEDAAESRWESRMTTRRVLTAIAIKQFKLQEGHWPKALNELTRVGLTNSDWKIVGNQDFGYRIVEDGNAVLLWTGGVKHNESPKWYEKSFRTPAQPPSETMLNVSYISSLQSTIR